MPSAFLQWLYADAADVPQTGYEVSRNSDPMSPKFTRPRDSASGSNMKTNLKTLIGLQQSAQLTAAAPMMGKTVEVESDKLSLQNGVAALRLPAAGTGAIAHV